MVTTEFDGTSEDQGTDENQADMEELRTRAEAGDPKSQTLLGHECFDSEDYAEATKWYLAAALQGHAEAQASLGDVYCHGAKEFQNYKEAVKWYKKAADQGYPQGEKALGDMYYDGLGVTQDRKKALSCFQTAAEKGDSEAQYSVGYCYEFGESCRKDVETAAEFYRKASEQGHSEGQFRLGLMHILGSIHGDPAMAEKWFRLAAEQGHPEAQTMLGAILMEGEVIQQNVPEALKWLREAVAQGEPGAQTQLGRMYSAGDGVPREPKTAVEFFRLAAEQDDLEGQYLLGQMILYGLGTSPNAAVALEWFRKAASLGHSEASEAVKHMEKVERELRQLGLTYESRKERIARLLLLVPREADGNWPWMDEKPLSKRNANKFFLYAILDYQMNVDQICQNIEKFVEKNLQDPPDLWDRIVSFSEAEWKQKSIAKEIFLHRYPAGHMRVWYIGKDIVEKYNGDAREIWENQSPETVMARLKSLGRGKEGIGNKLSVMTMGALFDSGQILVHKGSNPLDVKVDMHVKRVLGRALRGTGFEDSEAITVLEETRQMYPPIPYLLDQALYYLGKDTCHKNNPDCENCFLRSECAFAESAQNR